MDPTDIHTPFDVLDGPLAFIGGSSGFEGLEKFGWGRATGGLLRERLAKARLAAYSLTPYPPYTSLLASMDRATLPGSVWGHQTHSNNFMTVLDKPRREVHVFGDVPLPDRSREGTISKLADGLKFDSFDRCQRIDHADVYLVRATTEWDHMARDSGKNEIQMIWCSAERTECMAGQGLTIWPLYLAASFERTAGY